MKVAAITAGTYSREMEENMPAHRRIFARAPTLAALMQASVRKEALVVYDGPTEIGFANSHLDSKNENYNPALFLIGKPKTDGSRPQNLLPARVLITGSEWADTSGERFIVRGQLCVGSGVYVRWAPTIHRVQIRYSFKTSPNFGPNTMMLVVP